MSSNNNVHTPDEDSYYYCKDAECGCNDKLSVYEDIEEFLTALENLSEGDK